MAPVISPLLTGTLQHSLSQSPRGDNIKQRKKPFPFFCLLPQSSYLFSHPVFFFFIDFSHILPICPSLSLHSLHLFLCFIKFDILTTLFKYQHKHRPPPPCIFGSKMKIKAEKQRPQSRRQIPPPKIWLKICSFTQKESSLKSNNQMHIIKITSGGWLQCFSPSGFDCFFFFLQFSDLIP